MNRKQSAKGIVDALGGRDNIIHLTHCMTRLRFKLKDDSIVDQSKLEKTEGVLGTANANGIYQVIIGTNVDEMYDQIQNDYLSHHKVVMEEKSDKQHGPVSKALELISSTLSPLIPAIMGAGFISIMLAMFTQLGIMSSES